MNSKHLSRSILTKNYDLAGGGISRIIRLVIFSRVIPVGSLSTGPGVRCLLVLAVLHSFGGVLYRLRALYGERLRVIKRWIPGG